MAAAARWKGGAVRDWAGDRGHAKDSVGSRWEGSGRVREACGPDHVRGFSRSASFGRVQGACGPVRATDFSRPCRAGFGWDHCCRVGWADLVRVQSEGCADSCDRSSCRDWWSGPAAGSLVRFPWSAGNRWVIAPSRRASAGLIGPHTAASRRTMRAASVGWSVARSVCLGVCPRLGMTWLTMIALVRPSARAERSAPRCDQSVRRSASPGRQPVRRFACRDRLLRRRARREQPACRKRRHGQLACRKRRLGKRRRPSAPLPGSRRSQRRRAHPP